MDAKLLDNIKHLRDNGSNWKVWKTQIQIALEHQELLDFVEKQIPQPTPILLSPSHKVATGSTLGSKPNIGNADEIMAWDKGNHIARMQIFMTLEHTVADLFNDKAMASELWAAL